MWSLPGEFGSALPVSPGVIKLPNWGDPTMQMSDKIDGFLELMLKNNGTLWYSTALFGWVK